MVELKPKFTIGGVPFFWGGEDRKSLIEEGLKFEFEPDDILVAGYPRAGTTFRKQLIWLVAHNADVETAKSVKSRNRVVMIDRHETEPGELKATEKLQAMKDRPRVIFTHLPYTLLQQQAEAAGIKVIYLLRNPKDMIVSMYHVIPYFLPQIGEQFSKFSFNDMLKFMCGDFDRGNMLDHMISYWKHREDPRFLFLFYEENHKQYEAIVQQVAAFLGKTISPEQEKQISDFFQFDRYKQHMNAEVSTSKSTNEQHKDMFVRKGDVGQWKQHFTVAQNELYDQHMKEKLREHHIPFTFEL